MGKDLKHLNKMIRDYEKKEDKGAGDLMTLVYKAYLMGLDDSKTCPEAIEDFLREDGEGPLK